MKAIYFIMVTEESLGLWLDAHEEKFFGLAASGVHKWRKIGGFYPSPEPLVLRRLWRAVTFTQEYHIILFRVRGLTEDFCGENGWCLALSLLQVS